MAPGPTIELALKRIEVALDELAVADVRSARRRLYETFRGYRWWGTVGIVRRNKARVYYGF